MRIRISTLLSQDVHQIYIDEPAAVTLHDLWEIYQPGWNFEADVMFYSLQERGFLDQHSPINALPVTEGERILLIPAAVKIASGSEQAAQQMKK